MGAGSRSDVDRAEAAAAEFAQSLGGRTARSPRAFVHDHLVTVEVDLELPAIVPFFPRDVAREATEPLEEIVIEADR